MHMGVCMYDAVVAVVVLDVGVFVRGVPMTVYVYLDFGHYAPSIEDCYIVRQPYDARIPYQTSAADSLQDNRPPQEPLKSSCKHLSNPSSVLVVVRPGSLESPSSVKNSRCG